MNGGGLGASMNRAQERARPSPWTRNRGPAEMSYPHSRGLRLTLAAVVRECKRWTWGRIEVPGGAVRWDVDREGWVWIITSGDWQRLDREVSAAMQLIGWVHSGGGCWVNARKRQSVNG